MNLRAAYDLAQRIREQLEPWCERIEVAGSIRRAREHVNDIDLVLQPKPGELDALLERAKRHAQVVTDGPAIVILRLRNGAQLDLYFAHGGQRDMFEPQPSNWGSVLLCRTGSKEHNVLIAQRAQEMGLKWETMRGLVVAAPSPGGEGWGEGRLTSALHLPAGKLVAGETEEDIFQALGLDFIPPALRERPAHVAAT